MHPKHVGDPLPHGTVLPQPAAAGSQPHGGRREPEAAVFMKIVRRVAHGPEACRTQL